VNAVDIGINSNATPRGDAFGGNRQHDATEFLIFMTDILEDETNPNRAMTPLHRTQAQKDEAEKEMLKLPRFVAAQLAWLMEKRLYDSPLSRHMRGQFGYFKQCYRCGHETRIFAAFTQLDLVVPRDAAGNAPARGKLTDWLRQNYGEEDDDVYSNCENCQSNGEANWRDLRKRSSVYLTYLPDYLRVNIKRYDSIKGYTRKADTSVQLQDTPFDLDFAFLPDKATGHFSQPALERGQTKPFRYEVIAVMHHIGANASVGHYWTVARHVGSTSVSSTWHKFDDGRVTRANFSQVQGDTVYAMVLRRMGTDDNA
jgi:ubiquitin carboxyl-terminal hydrolase 8